MATNLDLHVARQVPKPDAAERVGSRAIGAGPMGIAPTSSTMRIAIGDGLGVARPITAVFGADVASRPMGIPPVADLLRVGLV